jgi:dihydrofolate synthase / folylpolyglutamate synthase
LNTYKEALDYLTGHLPMFQRIGAAAYKANLDNTLALSEKLGNPHKKTRCIHIAGTNGKGSVSNLVASTLQTAGYKTGLFTSPHLRDFRERIRVNGKKIPKAYVAGFVNTLKPFFEETKPSFFEMVFNLAMKYFEDEQTDVAVIETGMGGRLDSTNIITPVLSVITNIGYDHTKFLGETLHQIATEKAGIIKKNVPVIIGETHSLTREVFISAANHASSAIIFADQHLSTSNIRISNYKPGGIYMNISLAEGKDLFHDLFCPLGGVYQSRNIPTAIQACLWLNDLGFDISKENIRKGFRHVNKLTSFAGRWQILGHQPLTICDTAHNADGLYFVMEQLLALEKEKLHIVFGMVDDKDIEAILSLLPSDAAYYFCKPDVPRGLCSAMLTKAAADKNLRGTDCGFVDAAINKAKENAGENDVIFIGGSTFVVAEAL